MVLELGLLDKIENILILFLILYILSYIPDLKHGLELIGSKAKREVERVVHMINEPFEKVFGNPSDVTLKMPVLPVDGGEVLVNVVEGGKIVRTYKTRLPSTPVVYIPVKNPKYYLPWKETRVGGIVD